MKKSPTNTDICNSSSWHIESLDFHMTFLLSQKRQLCSKALCVCYDLNGGFPWRLVTCWERFSLALKRLTDPVKVIVKQVCFFTLLFSVPKAWQKVRHRDPRVFTVSLSPRPSAESTEREKVSALAWRQPGSDTNPPPPWSPPLTPPHTHSFMPHPFLSSNKDYNLNIMFLNVRKITCMLVMKSVKLSACHERNVKAKLDVCLELSIRSQSYDWLYISFNVFQIKYESNNWSCCKQSRILVYPE